MFRAITCQSVVAFLVLKTSALYMCLGLQPKSGKSQPPDTYTMGEVHPVVEWAEILDIKYSKLRSQILNGWDIERAFTTP